MEHVHHFASVGVSTGRNLYEIRSSGEGWFLYANVVDLIQTKQLWLQQTFSEREAKVTYYHHPEDEPGRSSKYSRWWPVWDNFLVVDRDELRGILLRPYVIYLDATTVQSEYDFSVPTTDLDFVQSKDGLFTEIVYGKGPSVTEATDYDDLKPFSTTWDPEHNVCPNIYFAAGFRRQALDVSIIERIDELALIADENPDRYFGTMILFGGTPRKVAEDGYANGFKWRLVIPVNSPPFLEEAFYINDQDADGTWVRRPWTSGSLAQVDAESAATTGKTYYIGVINDCICVSEDRFEDNFAIYRASDAGQPIVDAGAVRIFNWPGQCAQWIAPMGFVQMEDGHLSSVVRTPVSIVNFNADKIGPDRAYCYGFSPAGLQFAVDVLVWPDTPPLDWPINGDWTPYDPALIPDGGVVSPPYWPPHGQPGFWPTYPPPGWPLDEVWPPTYPPPSGVPTTAYAFLEGGRVFLFYWSPDSTPETAGKLLQWRVEFEPAVWAPTGQVPSFTTPFLTGVTVWQAADITTGAAQTYLPPSATVALTMAEAELGNDTSCNMEADIENTPAPYGGYPALNLREGALSEGTLGVECSDGTAPSITFGGMVLTGIGPDPLRGKLQFTDILGAMELANWDRGDLNLKYWNPAAAITCVCGLYGIPSSMLDLEDLGEVLLGDWTWEKASIRQVISDIAHRGQRGAAIWWDPVAWKIKTGCRYCRTKRTSATYASHQDNGWNSTGCLAADAARTPASGDKPAGVDFLLYADTSQDSTSLSFAENLTGQGTRLTGEFLNRVQAQGIGFDGYPLRLAAQDDYSISGDPDFEFERYIGWRKSRVFDVTDNMQTGQRSRARLGETTWDLLGQALIEAADCFGLKGVEIAGLRMPLATAVRVAQVCQVVGGEWGKANGKKFRVRGCSHGSDKRTTLHLQQMIGRLDT